MKINNKSKVAMNIFHQAICRHRVIENRLANGLVIFLIVPKEKYPEKMRENMSIGKRKRG